MRHFISFIPVAIEAISATTPEFRSVEEIFQAAIHSTRRVEEGGYTAFETLTREVVGRLLPYATVKPRIILATTKGEIVRQTEWMRDADSTGGARFATPTLGAALGRIEQHFGLRAGHVVSTACTSGLVALIEAAVLLTDAEAPAILALGADEASDFIRDGFHALRALSPDNCRPFDKQRNGLSLGSAAAGCLLTPLPNPHALALISGFGISNDATHMTAPDRHAGGLIRAIQAALWRAGLEPADIDVVFAHGTGTPYNDAMESVAIETVFLRAGASPAVTAVKGLIGHTLGAAGLIEAAIGVQMLTTQTILPITGLEIPDHSGIDFVISPRKAKIKHILKIASGFGGMNAAIVLSHPETASARGPLERGPSDEAFVIAAATATEERIHQIPAQEDCGREFTSPDPLAMLALRAIEPLVRGIPMEKRGSVGLILGTTLGCLEIDREFDRSRRDANGRYASPAAFSRTLPSSIAAELALKFGLTGPSLVLSAGSDSAAMALRRAMDWMGHFDLDFCIAGGLDFTGPGVGAREGKRVAVVLLSREREKAIARIERGGRVESDLAGRRDESLEQLGKWIENPFLGMIEGLRLVPERAPR